MFSTVAKFFARSAGPQGSSQYRRVRGRFAPTSALSQCATIVNLVNTVMPVTEFPGKERLGPQQIKVVGVTTLDIVRANKFVHEIPGADIEGTNFPGIGGRVGSTIIPLVSLDAGAATITREKSLISTRRCSALAPSWFMGRAVGKSWRRWLKAVWSRVSWGLCRSRTLSASFFELDGDVQVDYSTPRKIFCESFKVPGPHVLRHFSRTREISSRRQLKTSSPRQLMG